MSNKNSNIGPIRIKVGKKYYEAIDDGFGRYKRGKELNKKKYQPKPTIKPFSDEKLIWFKDENEETAYKVEHHEKYRISL